MNYSSYYKPPIKHGGLQVRSPDNLPWCGPAALCAALGITYKEALNAIKMTNLRKHLKAVSYNEMSTTLHQLGHAHEREFFPRESAECPKLRDWIMGRDPDKTYLVCITIHWIVIRGNHWVCSMNPMGRVLEQGDCPYLSSRVRHTICLTDS